jgi:hypothetical protein
MSTQSPAETTARAQPVKHLFSHSIKLLRYVLVSVVSVWIDSRCTGKHGDQCCCPGRVIRPTRGRLPDQDHWCTPLTKGMAYLNYGEYNSWRGDSTITRLATMNNTKFQCQVSAISQNLQDVSTQPSRRLLNSAASNLPDEVP